MKEHPVLFSTEMTKAILDGRKTQTRRIVKARKLHPDYGKPNWDEAFIDGKPPEPYLHVPFNGGEARRTVHRHFPKWEVGDRLWVKEDYKYLIQGDMVITYYKYSLNNDRVVYTPLNCLPEKTRTKLFKGKQEVWKSKLLMFKFMARTWLEITNIRVERVRNISEADVKAEGVIIRNIGETYWRAFRRAFRCLWEFLNAKRGYGWDKNPWVWVIEFEQALKG